MFLSVYVCVSAYVYVFSMSFSVSVCVRLRECLSERVYMANLGSPLSRLEFACFRFKRICLAFDVSLSVCLSLCLLEGLSSSLMISLSNSTSYSYIPVHERSVWISDRFLETNKTSLDPPLDLEVIKMIKVTMSPQTARQR